MGLTSMPKHRWCPATRQILDPESFERVDLVGPVRETVQKSMGEAAVAETAVARRGTKPAAFPFEHDNPPAGLRFERMQCSPQPRKSTTHDAEIGIDGACNGWPVTGCIRVVGPEDGGLRRSGERSRSHGSTT